jgi:Xaa-Pro aminopeptidase
VPSDPPPGTERPDWPTSPEQEAQEAQEAALIKVLSGMLGVDEAEVKAALDQIRAAYEAQGPAALDPYLDQAVQAGILTQEEADAVRQAIEQGWVDLGPR